MTKKAGRFYVHLTNSHLALHYFSKEEEHKHFKARDQGTSNTFKCNEQWGTQMGSTKFFLIFTLLNAIIQPCNQASLSHVHPNHLLIPTVRLQSAGSLLLPKQLHANRQCEMSVGLLISLEETPIPHHKVEEVISCRVFDLVIPFHHCPTTLPSRSTACSSSL